MNRIHRVVFNRSLGMMQVASELCASHVAGMGATQPRPRRLRRIALAMTLVLIAPPSLGQAVTLEGSDRFDLIENQTIGSLEGTADTTVSLGSYLLTTGGDNSSTTMAGQITGSGGLIKRGDGIFRLTGISTYTGGTKVEAGTLSIGQASALGTGQVTLENGAELVSTNSSSDGVVRIVTTHGRLSAATGANLTVHALLGSPHGGGTLHIGSAGNAGTVSVSMGNEGGRVGPSQVNVHHGTLRYGDVDAGIELTNGYGRLYIADAAVADLNGVDVFTSFLEGAGRIENQAPGTLSRLVVGAYLGSDRTAGPSSFSGVIADGLGKTRLIKQGENELTLSGPNTFSGGTVAQVGTLVLASSSALPTQGSSEDNPALLALGSAKVQAAAPDAITAGFFEWTNRSQLYATTARAVTGGSQTFVSTAQLHADAAQAIGGGSQSFLGDSQLNANRTGSIDGGSQSLGQNAVLQTGAADALTPKADVSFAFTHGSSSRDLIGGALALNGFSTTVGALRSRDGAGVVRNGGAANATLTLDSSVLGDSTFSGRLIDAPAGATGGSLALVKNGEGTFTLSGANTFSGGTTVNAGTLAIADMGALGEGDITLNNGAELLSTVSGTGTFGDLVSRRGRVSAATGTTFNVQSLVVGTSSAGGTLYIGSNQNSGTVGLFSEGGASIRFPIDVEVEHGTFRYGDNFVARYLTNYGGQLAVASGAVADLNGSAVNTSFLSGAGRIESQKAGTAASLTVGASGADSSRASAFSGAIADGAGAVSLIKEGVNTLTLTGANSYTGLTTISAGELHVGNGGTSGSLGLGAVVDNTVLAFNRSDDITVSNAISGTGDLQQLGGGVTTLTGDNTYDGATIISAGTLQLGDGGMSGNLSKNGTVANNGTLAFNRSDSFTFARSISGTGSVHQVGGGTTTLTRANTYTGGTVIKAGRIDIMSSTALGTGTVSMDDGTALGFLADELTVANPVFMTGTNDPTFDTGAHTTTLTGGITGAADLTKTGTGTLILGAANNTYTGSTTVAEGTLRAGIANAFAPLSAVAVAAGATLDTGGFNQTVGSLTNAGIVNLLSTAPGSTLTVNGNYVGNNGLLQLGTALGNSASVTDKLVVNGSASGRTRVSVTNLGGLGGQTTGNGIEIVSTTGGIVGTAFTLAHVVSAGAYDYRLTTTANAAYLSSLSNTPPPPPPPPAPPAPAPQPPAPAPEPPAPAPQPPAPAPQPPAPAPEPPAPAPQPPAPAPEPPTPAPRPPAPAPEPLTPAPPAPPAPAPSPALALPMYRAEASLYAALPGQLRESDLAMVGNMHQRLGDDATGASISTDASSHRQAWGRVVSTDRDIRQSGTVSPNSSGRLTGFQAGTDLWANPQWRTGVYVGQLEGDVRVSGFARGVQNYASGTNDLRSQYLGAYTTWNNNAGLYVDGVVQAGRHRYSVHPTAAFASSGKGDSLLASVEVGQAFPIAPRWVIEPQLQLVHQRVSLDDGSIVGAQVLQDSHSGWTVRAGVRVKGEFQTGAGTVQPYARLNVYKRSNGTDTARFIGPAAYTDIATATGGTRSELAVGALWQLSPRTSLYGELGKLWASGGDVRTRSGVNASVGVKLSW